VPTLAFLSKRATLLSAFVTWREQDTLRRRFSEAQVSAASPSASRSNAVAQESAVPRISNTVRAVVIEPKEAGAAKRLAVPIRQRRVRATQG
jgi:hypothetical protein